MTKRKEIEIIQDLRDIEMRLSPENLHCDGEISRAEAERKRRTLIKQRKNLIQEVGREPTWREIWVN
jgi:hypothetical protein